MTKTAAKVTLLVQGVLIEGELLGGEEALRVVEALPQLGEVIVLKNVKLISGGLSRSLEVMCIPRANIGGCGIHGRGGDTLSTLRELEELDAMRQLGWSVRE
ncbi:hypothetical protein FNU79_05310 [Deinococcus detaillensis]|uniref:Uncharacterized protein n=1 Tax=Deinococcus detaillensis TaxID=2592048 RepID=A0A553V4C8_9DEIO|nr:hypothetical protein [Deinococcus detaillensis]TSA87302.1 hypothetical protein FNU79_05310 [Deinococcus detaillensis]